jgi:hypothetical protein
MPNSIRMAEFSRRPQSAMEQIPSRFSVFD